MTRSPFTLEDATAQAAAFIEARRALHGSARMDATDGGDDKTGGTDATGGTDDDKGSQEPPKSVEEQLAEALAAVDEWKAHSRKHEDTAKARKAAADELAALKAKDATPDQRLAAAEERAAKAEAAISRFAVAAETGIPADLIVGDDEDSMRAYAERLKAFRGEAATGKKTPPKPDPTQGGTGGDKKVSAADAGKAEAARRFADRKKN